MILVDALKRIAENIRSHRFVLAAILLPFTIRAIPEIIAGPYPIGYDTITAYVPFMRDWAAGNAGTHFTSEVGGWLLFVALGMAYATTKVDPLAIVKITGPLLYGFLGISEYIFVRKVLQWDQRKSFLLMGIASIYFVSLRISWDLYRNTLGLALMLLTLVIGSNVSSKKKLITFSGMIVVTALSHLLVATILIGVILSQALASRSDIKKAVAAVPGAVVCGSSLIGFRAQGISAISQGLNPVGSLSLYAFSLYAFLPLIPMVFLGRTLRASIIKWWLIICVIGLVVATTPLAISSQLVSPDRWTLMMFFPLVVLSVEGFSRIGKPVRVTRFFPTIRMTWIMLLLVLFVGYASMQAGSAFPYYSYFAPTSMLQSTVPLQDSQGVVDSFHWLSNNTPAGSTILAPDPIYGWVREYYTGSAIVAGFGPGTTFVEALHRILEASNGPIYTVWWANGHGWYSNPAPPLGFVLQHQNGDFGVFLYAPQTLK